MLPPSMASSRSTKPRTTKTPRTTGHRTSKAVAAKPAADAPKSLAEIGKEAAQRAQAEALLAACKRLDWNLSAVARELSLNNTSNVIRSLRSLGLEDEYKAARRAEYED